MELVSIENVNDVEVGDVVVANWPGEAITARVLEIQRSRDGELEGESMKFLCGPTTHIRHYQDRPVMSNYDAEEFIFPFEEEPLSVFVVR
jgi:hypothetical protein